MAGMLVGIDGSIASRAAVTWTLAHARATGQDVELRYVVDDESGTIGSSVIAELRSEATALVDRELEFAREQADGVTVTASYSVGSPMLELAIDGRHHDGVAIGTHKVGTFHGLALGTRAMQLAAMSPVPLAVIPVASGGRRSGVVVGVGGAPGEEDVIRIAVAEARRRQQPLVLLRVHGTSAAASADALEHALRLAERLGIPSGITVRQASSSAGETLAAMSGRATLTIAGRPTRADARGFRPLGRTVGDLVMNLGGPVLIVPFVLEHTESTNADGPAPWPEQEQQDV